VGDGRRCSSRCTPSAAGLGPVMAVSSGLASLPASSPTTWPQDLASDGHLRRVGGEWPRGRDIAAGAGQARTRRAMTRALVLLHLNREVTSGHIVRWSCHPRRICRLWTRRCRPRCGTSRARACLKTAGTPPGRQPIPCATCRRRPMPCPRKRPSTRRSRPTCATGERPTFCPSANLPPATMRWSVASVWLC
jgi:hypothetical protein